MKKALITGITGQFDVYLVALTRELTGFEGEVIWNTYKSDGTIRKQLDVSLMQSLEWTYKIELKEGIKKVYHSKFLN